VDLHSVCVCVRACVAPSPTRRQSGGGGTYRSYQKHESLSLHDLLSTGRHLIRVSFVTRLKSNLCAALNTQNTTGNNFNSHAQNTTALHSILFLTEIHRSPDTNKWRPAFRSASKWQGQLQTPQSVSAPPRLKETDTILCKNYPCAGHEGIWLSGVPLITNIDN
jgi:hypothetical protein